MSVKFPEKSIAKVYGSMLLASRDRVKFPEKSVTKVYGST